MLLGLDVSQDTCHRTTVAWDMTDLYRCKGNSYKQRLTNSVYESCSAETEASRMIQVRAPKATRPMVPSNRNAMADVYAVSCLHHSAIVNYRGVAKWILKA